MSRGNKVVPTRLNPDYLDIVARARQHLSHGGLVRVTDSDVLRYGVLVLRDHLKLENPQPPTGPKKAA